MTAAEQLAQAIYRKYFQNGATSAPFLTNVTVTPNLQGPTGINPEYCATAELAADFLPFVADMGFDVSPMEGPPALEEPIGEGQNYSAMVPWLSINGFNSDNAAVNVHSNLGILANTINTSINKSEANPRFGTVVREISGQIQDQLNSAVPAGN